MKYSSGVKKYKGRRKPLKTFRMFLTGRIIPLCLGTGTNCPEFTGHKTNHSKYKRMKL